MRIAIAGLGTVGSAVVRLLRTHAELLIERGQEVSITAVSAHRPNRDSDLTGVDRIENPLDLATRSDVDAVVELIGGAEGISHDLAKAAIANGKHFVTANKALIATHGADLVRSAEAAGVQLSFEAAVCGGIPILNLLREGLSANRITSVRGILNGTCNFILTRMEEEGMDFASALGEAQQQGYAEADPTADIDGHDSANKLAILSALSFGINPDLSSVFVEGIRSIVPSDLRDASERGGRIKLLGIATCTDSEIVQRVQPVFVPYEEPLARVEGVLNGIEISGDFVGDLFLQGAGAGGDATASAVVADLIDIAEGHRNFAFGIAADKLG